MIMKRLWSMVAVLCLVVSALFLWRSRLDAAFVMASLGVVAWFLNLRNQFQRTQSGTGNTSPAEDENSED